MESIITFIRDYGLILFGAFFMFVAGLGILILPDVFTRLHANTKSATMGAGCILLGAAFYFGDTAINVRLILLILFLFATAPVAGHMIGRAAYFSDEVKIWDKTLSDALEGNYDKHTHEVRSPAEKPKTRKASTKK